MELWNLRRRWPLHILKAGCYPRRHSICRESQFLRVFGGFVGFGIVAELLSAQTQCFQRIQNLLCFSRFCWALLRKACIGLQLFQGSEQHGATMRKGCRNSVTENNKKQESCGCKRDGNSPTLLFAVAFRCCLLQLVLYVSFVLNLHPICHMWSRARGGCCDCSGSCWLDLMVNTVSRMPRRCCMFSTRWLSCLIGTYLPLRLP